MPRLREQFMVIGIRATPQDELGLITQFKIDRTKIAACDDQIALPLIDLKGTSVLEEF